MNTDIQKIRSALMVAKYLNISEAAYNLSFTPSAVSKQIMSLENDMEMTLFERHSRSGVTLTNEGRIVLPLLQKVVTDLDELEGTIRSMSDSPKFWLGTAPIFPARITGACLSRLSKRMPDVEVNMLHHDNKTLIELVRMGRLDAGISTILGSAQYNPEFQSIHDKNMEIKTVLKEDEIIILNEKHPLVDKPEIKMNDLLFDPNNTFIFVNPTPNIPSPRQLIFDAECRKRGVKPRTKIVSLEVSLATATVKRTIANDVHYVAFYPQIADIPSGAVKRYVTDNIYESQIVTYYMKNNRSRRIKAFLEGVESIISDGYIE